MSVLALPLQPRAAAVLTQQPTWPAAKSLASVAGQHGCVAEVQISVASLQHMYGMAACAPVPHLILAPGQQVAEEEPSARFTTR
jgi:hypothetical protein